MEIDFSKWYRVLSPRPVALISTVNEKGKVNAAPFSFVMPCSVEPPLVEFASDPEHHTAKNILKTKEFVLNLPDEKILDKLWKCAEDYPEGVNEIEKSGLTERSSKQVKVPGISECFASIECKLHGNYVTGDHITFVGEVVRVYVADGCFRHGEFLVKKANPLGHVGGKNFGLVGKIIKVK